MSGSFLNYTVKPWSRLAVTLGLRSDYSDYTDNLTFSPRAAVSMRLSDKTKLNAAAGIYYESQPIVILAQTEKIGYLTTWSLIMPCLESTDS